MMVKMNKPVMNPKCIENGLLFSAILWLVIFFVLLSLWGCSQPDQITSAEGHIYFMPKGVEIRTTNYGTITTKYKGAWLSEFLLREYIELKETELSR